MTRTATGTRRIKGLADRYVNRLIALSFILRKYGLQTYCAPVVRLHKWPIQVAGLTEITRSIGPKRRPRPIMERQRHARTRVRTFRISHAT